MNITPSPLKVLVIVGFLVAVGISLMFFQFHGGFSEDPNVWGAFGTYIGAIATIGVVVINLYLIYYQVRKDALLQRQDRFRSFAIRYYDQMVVLRNTLLLLTIHFDPDRPSFRKISRNRSPKQHPRDLRLVTEVQDLLFEIKVFPTELERASDDLKRNLSNYIVLRHEEDKHQNDFTQLDKDLWATAERLRILITEALGS